MSSVLSVSDNCERGMAGTLQFGNDDLGRNQNSQPNDSPKVMPLV